MVVLWKLEVSNCNVETCTRLAAHDIGQDQERWYECIQSPSFTPLERTSRSGRYDGLGTRWQNASHGRFQPTAFMGCRGM
jgi:hypothetical protein